MSEQEEIKLFERIRENIQQTQKKLFERKAKLGESVVIADENGQPVTIRAQDLLGTESTQHLQFRGTWTK
jgi:hypothetical protein